MTSVKLKKTHKDAKIPTQNDGDVGFDVYAVEDNFIGPHDRKLIVIGWKLADEPIVSGSCIHGNLRMLLKVEPRSGMALKFGVWPLAGIIDPSYRGEIGVILYNSTFNRYTIRKGDKIAQLVLYPVVANWAQYGKSVTFDEVDDIVESSRNEAGFGSSGN